MDRRAFFVVAAMLVGSIVPSYAAETDVPDAGPARGVSQAPTWQDLGKALGSVSPEAIVVRKAKGTSEDDFLGGLAGFLQKAIQAATDPIPGIPRTGHWDEVGEDERKNLDVSLPFTFPSPRDVRESDHIIFYDNTAKEGGAAFHEPRWKLQSEVLRKKLLELGAEEGRVHVYPVKRKEDFFFWLKQHPGAKKVYVFGHASPLVIHFGEDDVDMPDVVRKLEEQGVDTMIHYGCSFLNVDPGDLGPLQARLEDGTHITLYGHRRPSTKDDDSPYDEDNPLMRLQVTQDGARLYDAKKELAAGASRVAGTLLSMSGLERFGVELPRSMRDAARYDGEEPVKLQEPSPFDGLVKMFMRWRKSRSAPAKPAPDIPAPTKPVQTKQLRTARPAAPPPVPQAPATAPRKPADPVGAAADWLKRLVRPYWTPSTSRDT